MATKLRILPLLWIFTGAFAPISPLVVCETRAEGTGATAGLSGSAASTVGQANRGRAKSTVVPAGTVGATPGRQESNGDPGPAIRPQSLLATAIERLESRSAVSAQIRHEVNLFEKSLAGFGSYWEERQGRNRLIRLELRIQLGDRTSTLLQVCDGRFLWTYRKLLGNGKLTRIDVAKAMEGLEKAEKMPGKEDVNILPGLGGLPKLLRGLHASFEFTSVESGRWKKMPVWQLHGQWKTHRLKEALPDQKKAIEAGNPPDVSRLPAHLPDHVVLLLGKGDLFPYRIEYRKSVSDNILRPGSPGNRALVTMELFHVEINGPIDRSCFFYNPGDLEPTDQTQRFLESLGVKE